MRQSFSRHHGKKQTGALILLSLKGPFTEIIEQHGCFLSWFGLLPCLIVGGHMSTHCNVSDFCWKGCCILDVLDFYEFESSRTKPEQRFFRGSLLSCVLEFIRDYWFGGLCCEVRRHHNHDGECNESHSTWHDISNLLKSGSLNPDQIKRFDSWIRFNQIF